MTPCSKSTGYKWPKPPKCCHMTKNCHTWIRIQHILIETEVTICPIWPSSSKGGWYSSAPPLSAMESSGGLKMLLHANLQLFSMCKRLHPWSDHPMLYDIFIISLSTCQLDKQTSTLWLRVGSSEVETKQPHLLHFLGKKMPGLIW